MRIRKIDKKRIMAAIILSVTFLFEGCGTDIIRQEKTAPNVESEEDSSDNLLNTDNAEEDYETFNMDNAEEDYEAFNTDDISEDDEAVNEEPDMYDHILEEYRDMVQNDFYIMSA